MARELGKTRRTSAARVLSVIHKARTSDPLRRSPGAEPRSPVSRQRSPEPDTVARPHRLPPLHDGLDSPTNSVGSNGSSDSRLFVSGSRLGQSQAAEVTRSRSTEFWDDGPSPGSTPSPTRLTADPGSLGGTTSTPHPRHTLGPGAASDAGRRRSRQKALHARRVHRQSPSPTGCAADAGAPRRHEEQPSSARAVPSSASETSLLRNVSPLDWAYELALQVIAQLELERKQEVYMRRPKEDSGRSAFIEMVVHDCAGSLHNKARIIQVVMLMRHLAVQRLGATAAQIADEDIIAAATAALNTSTLLDAQEGQLPSHDPSLTHDVLHTVDTIQAIQSGIRNLRSDGAGDAEAEAEAEADAEGGEGGGEGGEGGEGGGATGWHRPPPLDGHRGSGRSLVSTGSDSHESVAARGRYTHMHMIPSLVSIPASMSATASPTATGTGSGSDGSSTGETHGASASLSPVPAPASRTQDMGRSWSHATVDSMVSNSRSEEGSQQGTPRGVAKYNTDGGVEGARTHSKQAEELVGARLAVTSLVGTADVPDHRRGSKRQGRAKKRRQRTGKKGAADLTRLRIPIYSSSMGGVGSVPEVTPPSSYSRHSRSRSSNQSHSPSPFSVSVSPRHPSSGARRGSVGTPDGSSGGTGEAGAAGQDEEGQSKGAFDPADVVASLSQDDSFSSYSESTHSASEVMMTSSLPEKVLLSMKKAARAGAPLHSIPEADTPSQSPSHSQSQSQSASFSSIHEALALKALGRHTVPHPPAHPAALWRTADSPRSQRRRRRRRSRDASNPGTPTSEGGDAGCVDTGGRAHHRRVRQHLARRGGPAVSDLEIDAALARVGVDPGSTSPVSSSVVRRVSRFLRRASSAGTSSPAVSLAESCSMTSLAPSSGSTASRIRTALESSGAWELLGNEAQAVTALERRSGLLAHIESRPERRRQLARVVRATVLALRINRITQALADFDFVEDKEAAAARIAAIPLPVARPLKSTSAFRGPDPELAYRALVVEALHAYRPPRSSGDAGGGADDDVDVSTVLQASMAANAALPAANVLSMCVDLVSSQARLVSPTSPGLSPAQVSMHDISRGVRGIAANPSGPPDAIDELSDAEMDRILSEMVQH